MARPPEGEPGFPLLPLLAVLSGRHSRAALETAAFENHAPPLGSHALAEAVLP